MNQVKVGKSKILLNKYIFALVGIKTIIKEIIVKNIISGLTDIKPKTSETFKLVKIK